MDDKDPALKRAIEAAGGPAELARFITQNHENITAQAICDWKRCPPTRVLMVERASGVSRHELRPDIYPLQEQAA
jgi:DNA-binding transcriptional regulator YdaS (Cro superfamily)